MKKRNGSIDFWKFVFSLVIAGFHSIYFARGEKFFFYDGANMVEFFFLVSGFLMAASVMKQDSQGAAAWKSTWRFLFHKIKGMFPAYYVAWAVAFVIKNAAGGFLPLALICKHGILSIWELFFLRMAGFNDWNANGATWYISAMLWVMLLLLPFFFKNKDFFLHITAPVLAIGILGYLYASTRVLRGNTDWTGICFKGLLRAAGVLCTGCVCYLACQKLKELTLTAFSKILLSIVEIGGYLFALFWTFGHDSSRMEFVILVLFAVSVTISFSHQGILAPVFDNRAAYWLGSFSFPLFLAHHAWSGRMNKLFPQDSYEQLFVKYALLSFATAVLVSVLSGAVRRIYGKHREQHRGLFVKTEKSA